MDKEMETVMLLERAGIGIHSTIPNNKQSSSGLGIAVGL